METRSKEAASRDGPDVGVYAPPLPSDIHVNPIRTGADWRAMREACVEDPGAFHGAIAARVLHWYHPDLDAWLTRGSDGTWRGWRVADGEDCRLDDEWTPWTRAFDDRDAPFYRWFSGGLTNAAFNEVDRHVAAGFGDEPAYFFEGDRWDPAANDGRGGPVHQRVLTRRDLFIQSVVAARALADLGLAKGDRIALNMPNILEQIVWTEGAKRLGVIYTPVFGGFSDKTLSDRIADAGARVVITADGASRNAEIAPFKEAYTDPALDRFIDVPTARTLIAEVARKHHAPALAAALSRAVAEELAGEITVLPAEAMRALGKALEARRDLDPGTAAELRADLAEALARAPDRVEKVIVVRHAGLADVPWTETRDVWAHDLLAEAERAVCAAAGVPDMNALGRLDDRALARALWRAVPCRPVDAEFPLFIIYTSGSTGKPKGVVHVHGGYLAGVAQTMAVSFDAVPGRDVIYVVADPGWITGQSYLISASLAARIPGIVAEGAPVFPTAGRFASIIERHRVTIFKAGVTFLKTVMTNPQNRKDVARYDMSSLRVATFCAEPTSPTVQRFGMELMTPRYINSYWATEHGGIVWTHPYGNPDLRLRADARTYPLPWVMGDVWVPEGEPDDRGRVGYRKAAPEEKGEIVITAPYPYLARTIWGDAGNVGKPEWKGDIARFASVYFGRFREPSGAPAWAYLQGDFARRYEDGSFSLHGRSDDVINVSGHRIGTEEIEGAILKDKQVNPDSPVGNCIVVGAPHPDKGLTPVAFILLAPGRGLSGDDERRLRDLVREEKGAVAVPSDFITVRAFPETRSGKYMRRYLRAMMLGETLGDTTTLRNPESLDEIAERIAAWRHAQARAETQTLIERRRFIRVEYDEVGRDAAGEPLRVATLVLSNPPVNALSERLLDELDLVLTHVARRPDVGAVVIAAAGSGTFVAGADVLQLLEEIHGPDEAQALPRKAHAAFARIEAMDKPVVAAVDGVALGGGCELALACHYRVGSVRTRLGQPEINLFLPPGYGGTQRLPRLLEAAAGDRGLGVRRALAMLLSGRRVDGEAAHAMGLLDELTTGAETPLAAALARAREAALLKEGALADAHRARRRLVAEWKRPDVFPAAEAKNDPYLRICRAQAAGTGRGKVAARIEELVRIGFEQGFESGLRAEIAAFAELVMDAEDGGRKGIALFLDKRSPPLPARPRPAFSAAEVRELEQKGELLPMASPFTPGLAPLPRWQHAFAVVRDRENGAPRHGAPRSAEVAVVVPVPEPGPDQALLYMLVSEVNYNDIWAITGIPVSLFDEHDEDVHVTGSGGLGLVAALGESLQREGRLGLGDLVAVYSGVSDLMNPEAGRDPMFTRFHIQGYQSPDGSHQQFMTVDGPQCLPLPAGLTIEQAGSYILAGGTVYRALFTTLAVRAGRRLFVEGAATGTGAWALRLAGAARVKVTGLVSSEARAQTVRALGAAAIDRTDPAVEGCFTRVPADPGQWATWEREGEALLARVRAANGGELVDYAVSHAGERAFPRSFQTLAPGGRLAFWGASTGYHLTFMGKHGAGEAATMLERADLRPGEAVLVWYGADDGQRDATALVAIEAARAAGGRIVVVAETDADRDFVLSLGFGDAVVGAVSLAEIARRAPRFEWPATMPDMPDPQRETAAFKEAVRRFTENVFKPLGRAVGRVLRSSDNPRGMPDIVVERAHRDSLAVSTMLVKPNTGRVVYMGDMGGRRYSFYAPQVWMRQRAILMPSAEIRGTHLCNAAEVAALNRLIEAGMAALDPPYLAAWDELPEVHQAMWENRLPEYAKGAAKAVVNHALPEPGLRDRDDLLMAWDQASKRGA